MSCKISRRNFMRCAGIGALALTSGSLLGGCTSFDAEYGLNETASWTDKNGTVTMKLAQALEITATSHTDLAEKYQLKIDGDQWYVYLRFDINSSYTKKIAMYNKRYELDWFEGKYTDDSIREYLYQWEKDAEDTSSAPLYPNANRMVKTPGVIWAYNNGIYLNTGKFGSVCYTGMPGEPRQATTYAEIPQGASYVECIGQVSQQLQTLRIVYKLSGKEINFVLTPADLG